MHFKKIILAGLGVDAVSIFIPYTSYNFFSWIFELPPVNIWKWTPHTEIASIPLGTLVYILVVNTVLAIFLAFLYAYFYKSLPYSGIKKGLLFGLLLYPIAVLIPMFSIHVLLNVAGGAVVYFTLQGLLEFLLYGATVGLIYKPNAKTKMAI